MNKSISLLFVLIGLTCGLASIAATPTIRIDTRDLPVGILAKFKVNGLPVFVLHRSDSELTYLRKRYKNNTETVPGCATCDPLVRSISPEILVISGYNTSSGCEFIYVASTATNWVGYPVNGIGGFVDNCSGTEYDLSGRKLSGPTTSPSSIGIPPYLIRNGVITIDESESPKL